MAKKEHPTEKPRTDAAEDQVAAIIPAAVSVEREPDRQLRLRPGTDKEPRAATRIGRVAFEPGEAATLPASVARRILRAFPDLVEEVK